MNDLIQVPFHGDHITAIMVDESPMIALKPVCERFGLDWEPQRKRLARKSWASTSIMEVQLPGDTQARQVTFSDRRTFTMWLATIEASRIKDPEVRALVEMYQDEAADALDRYFHEGGAVNPRAKEHQINALIYQARAQMEILQVARGLVHPDFLEAKGRILIAQAMGETPELDPKTRPLYTHSFLKEKNLSAKQTRSIAPTFGKRMKAAFFLKHGKDPHKAPITLTNGRIIDTYAYTEADRPLFNQVWDEHYANRQVAA